jgi:beta-lactamase class A
MMVANINMQTFSRNHSYQFDRRQPLTRRKNRLILYIAIGGVSAVILTVTLITKNVFFNHNGKGATDHIALASDNKKAQKSAVPKRQVDTSGLQTSLNLIIKKYPYDTSVSVIDLNSGNLIQTGDSYPFIAASTTKLLTALYYLNQVEAGQTGLDTQVSGKSAEEQLRLAVKNSDNDAWLALNNYLGRNDLAAYAKEHGIMSYSSSENTITSNDMAQLMAQLYNRKLINENHTKLLLSWMQNTSEERFIPPAVPAGSVLYHKAGYLADRVHDVGIIDNGSAPFVIVIYSKSFTPTYDYDSGQRLFKEVTEQTVSTFK